MDSLAQIAEEIHACVSCPLWRTRTRAVPGEGAANAAIVLIGEAPGANEDMQGRPFVGRSGKFLNELLAEAGCAREDVFITNMVKCRPPRNRPPLPTEVRRCSQFLDRQLAIIRPRIIITLGRIPMARWFLDQKITNIHGIPHAINGHIVVPMFHPAAALYRRALYKTIKEDFSNLWASIQSLQESARTISEPG